jgi:hypothetical protein
MRLRMLSGMIISAARNGSRRQGMAFAAGASETGWSLARRPEHHHPTGPSAATVYAECRLDPYRRVACGPDYRGFHLGRPRLGAVLAVRWGGMPKVAR